VVALNVGKNGYARDGSLGVECTSGTNIRQSNMVDQSDPLRDKLYQIASTIL
jgi:hypothetical protein